MTEQTNPQTSAQRSMDEEIRRIVVAWLRDVFENGRY